jgi:ribonucleoside-diphosphate reductase alpha chain
MTGGGIGIDYSRLRPEGKPLSRTGGLSSGPIPLMQMINEVGRGVMQGGSRRSAIYASLNWLHEDIPTFLKAKNWSDEIKVMKNKDFNFAAPLDMTNISVNYDDKWLYNADRANLNTFQENCRQAMMTGEPGFSFNFGDKQDETLRNACTEVTSADDSDVCNLGSINIGNIESFQEFQDVVSLASKFLVCGTLRADLPYDKVYKVREKNRRLGLGLMGIHAWLLKRGASYEVTPELKQWLQVYKDESERAANEHCERLYISRPVAYRAIAPTGSIGILAGTTTGIEPLFAVAYKRRYLVEGTKWKYEYVVDSTADQLIKEYGLDPSKIDTAYGLSHNYEQRIRFQADIQDYVDMSISSTINLPSWGSKGNSEADVGRFAETLSKYAPRLRGFTCYPDGSRGGQPLTECSYEEATKHKGVVFEENIDRACVSGVCGL